MKKRGHLTRSLTVAATLSLAVLAAGCTVDIDLVTTPDTVPLGGDVNFDVKVTNLSTCPVGDVQVVVFPFIPPDELFTGEEEIDAALRFLCSEGSDLPDFGGIDCSLVGEQLVCIFDPAENLGDGQETIVLGAGDETGQIRCTRQGNTLTCSLPTSLAEVIEQQGAVAPLSCAASSVITFCSTTLLNVGETQSDDFTLPVSEPGSLRNLAFVVASRDNGVCKLGTPGVPCNDNNDCSGIGNTCGNGLCAGGMKNGFGCTTGVADDCPGGTCTDCGPPENGQSLAGGACTTTLVGVQAPAMSPWSIMLTAIAMLGLGALAARRRWRRQV